MLSSKKVIPISFAEKAKTVEYAFQALKNTVVLMVKNYGQDFGDCLFHIDDSGKVIYRKELTSYKSEVYAFMINQQQIVLWQRHDGILWLIDLKSHKEWKTTVETSIKDGQIHYFKETKLICLKNLNKKYFQFVYYAIDQLKNSNSKPFAQQNYHRDQLFEGFPCNTYSKFRFNANNSQQTFEFSYFDLDSILSKMSRKVKTNKGIQISINYEIFSIREIQLNVYLIIFCKDNQEYRKDPLFKFFILDATKNELMASIKEIQLPFKINQSHSKMQREYFVHNQLSFFDLGDIWVFHFEFLSKKEQKKTYQLQYAVIYYIWRRNLELLHFNELTYLDISFRNDYRSHFLPFYYMQIDNKGKNTLKDFDLHITTLFSHRQVSLHFLLHIDQDLDDDLLMDALNLIA